VSVIAILAGLQASSFNLKLMPSAIENERKISEISVAPLASINKRGFFIVTLYIYAHICVPLEAVQRPEYASRPLANLNDCTATMVYKVNVNVCACYYLHHDYVCIEPSP
jgi:hypothetical protein